MEAPQCRFQIYGISWGDADTAIAQAFLSLTYYGKSPAGSGGSSRKSRSPGAHRAFCLVSGILILWLLSAVLGAALLYDS